MVQFNTRANEILLKLVYYGPGLSGKTTNLQALHAMCSEANRGEMFSVNTQEDRTLFFDLLPINLGYIYGNAIHLQIYTVPGQVQYDASRRVVLGGADGVVFVADSSESKMQENVDSLSNLYHNLNVNRLNIKQIPFVIQFNKRDLPDAMAVGVMNRRLNFRSVPYFESVANRGEGVLDTFLSITRDTVGTTFRKYHLDKKIKDFDEMLNLIDSNIRSSMREMPKAAAEVAPPPPQESTVLRHSGVSITELAPGKAADAQELLEDALQSNMETARLYAELKGTKESLEKKNEELRQIYTQLERSNQDNLKTRRYLEGLIQSVGEAIVSFAADGRILTWNAAAERIFGYGRAEIVGRTFHQLAPPDRSSELEDAIARVSRGETLRDTATVRLRKDGSQFPARITYAPIRGNDDRVLAFSALIRDEGEQKRLERRLADMEHLGALAKLLPQAYLELNDRLTPVLAQRDLLMRSLDPDSAAVAGKLLAGVDHVFNLLRPMLLVFSPSTPTPEPASLNALVQACIKQVEGEAAAAGVALEATLDPDLPDSALDTAMVREGILCLLRSGLRACAKSTVKRLRVGTRHTTTGIQLVVQDTGPAPAAVESRRLFDVAAAADLESLGPSVFAAVAKAHGGSVTSRSQPGLGNAFLVELPLVEAPAAPATPVGLEGLRVLVVDDEQFLLECLTDALDAWGCVPAACAQASEAIQKLQEGTFDLIICDIRMPGLSGIQFFDWLQANRPAMAGRILFTTGDSFEAETRAFLERTRLPHLGKPFDLRKLKASIGDLLAST
jgi:PAS domain S-box-containing protein